MKKSILILIGMIVMVSNTEAKTDNNTTSNFGANYYYKDAVNFIERGIEFFIFTNGDFDFNINQNDSYYDYNESTINNNNNNNNRVRINRDYKGRITRIENTFINYDFRGNVSRIGSIFIRYHRDRLVKVGDLRIRYNRYGFPFFYGNVRDYYYNNGVRFNINFGDVCDYNDAYFYRNEFSINYNQFREDANFYYYKANPDANIGKRSTILKRRKPASNIDRNKDVVRRNSNNSYRKPANNKRDDAIKGTQRESTLDNNREIRKDTNSSYRKSTNDKKSTLIRESRRTTNEKIDRNNRNQNADKNSKKEEITRKREN